MAMRAPLRRKAPAKDTLGIARVIALLASLAAAAVTYLSVQSLGQLVLQQHSGLVAAGVGSSLSSGSSWKETWRLASELGTESLRLGLRHGPRPLSPRIADNDASSRAQLPQHLADASGSAATKAAQVGSRLGLEAGASSGSASTGSGSTGSVRGGSGAVKSGVDSALASLPAQCNVAPHTDFTFGEPVRWGSGNLVDGAGECCRQCREYKPASENDVDCNVWVWCGEKAGCGEHHRECWLKHLAHPDAVVPNEGPKVPWTAGFVGSKEEEALAVVDPSEDRSYHTVITAEGSATHWQSRIGYYHFLKAKKACQKRSNCQMGGFTRVLHSGKPDDLMDEIPTFVVDPLPPEKHNHGSYVVINRPYAFVQWTARAKIKEKYVLMSEPDHIWLRPMPNLMKGKRPAAFPFFYIEPSKKEFLPITEKFTGKLTLRQAERIAPIGNAPTMMAFDDLSRVAPLWVNLSLAIFLDTDANKEWGWVQEMYAFTLASYNAGIPRIDLHKKMMAQPPWDTELDPYYILHYTYGNDFTPEGVFTPGKVGAWHFDKRAYAKDPVARHLAPPPKGCKNYLVFKLIDALNEATDTIPGWDDYIRTGVAKQLWDGKTFGRAGVKVKEMADAEER